MARKPGLFNWSDVAWMTVMAAQGGMMVALPVLVGLVVGFWLDSRWGTLPWISLLLTIIGSILGPTMLYRWVTAVASRRAEAQVRKTQLDVNESDEGFE
jgi:F0F1-type ATP synthase assembly protein I